MSDKLRIAVVTTSRADYGLLVWPLRKLLADDHFDVKLVVSGTHLSPAHGLTYKKIEEDGFKIDWRVDMLLSSDTALGACKSLGIAVMGFGEAFAHLKPDLVLLLGDRYEMFAAAQCAMLNTIPIAHIAGGDFTIGAFDDAIRHSITKMAHIHFPTNEDAAQRIRQLGENPEHVHMVGSSGIDYIRHLEPMTRTELESMLNTKLGEKNILVTYHPETLEEKTVSDFSELVKALKGLDSSVGIVVTRPNADPLGKAIEQQIDVLAETKPEVCVFSSLGSKVYLNVMNQVDAVVGNSSSGIYEAPSLKTPTVNIGNRQKGRLTASSVLNVPAKADEILDAIQHAMTLDCSSVKNPYGDGTASERIVQVLREIRNPQKLIHKPFFKV